MDYENVLGERKFPTYEQLKTGLLRLIDEGKISREDAFRLLPELRESEDERIRRRMVEHFKSKTKETWCSIPVKDILKWLEKQKVLTEHNEGIYYYHRDGTFTFISSPAVENPHNFTVPKPNVKPVDDDPLNDPRFIDGFDTGREVQKIFDEPAEWSEEDERRIDAICELLENTSAIHPNYSHRKLIIWLKSLRPSWKPTPEQLDTLHTAAYLPEMEFYGGLKYKLRELYEHLINEL